MKKIYALLFTIITRSYVKYSHLIKLNAIILLICLACDTNAQLVLNEMSQGQSGTKEYIELVVIGNRTCTDSTADIRNWVIDDNNGWLGAATGQGIAQGCMRFANAATWEHVPYGSIILIYNDGDKNSSISLPDDPTDANHDYVYIVPASSTELENNSSTPSAPSSPTYVYPTTGFNAGGSWARMGLANGGDGIVITSAANLAVAYFSFGYGGINNSSNATVYKSTSGGAKCYYLTDNQYSSSASWDVGASPANETPGAPNSVLNADWINSLRQSSGSNVPRDTTTLSGCNSVTYNGNTYNSSVVFTDTIRAVAGCDSVYHVTNIVIQSLTGITITPSGPTTFCSGGSVTLSAPVLTVTNNALDFTGTGKYVHPNDLPSFYDNFSFECWVNPTATIVLAPEATSGTQGTSGERYVLYPTWGGSNNSITGPGNPDAGAGLSVGTNGIAVYEHGASYLAPLLVWAGAVSGWTHIAVVYTNKQPSLYINGVFVKTGLTSLKNRVYPSLGQWPGNLYNLSGGIGGGNYGYFNGQIDEFRLWDVPLSPATILADYNKIIQPLPAANLYAYYRFDEGTGNVTADLSGNNLQASLINSPVWVVPASTPLTGYGSAYTYLWLPGNETDPAITVSASGTFSVTVTNSAGCSQTVSQMLQTIVPVAQTQAVNGCTNVVFNGITYTTTSTIMDTTRSINGCDSVITTVNIRVNDISSANVIDSIYEGQSYTLPSGIVVNAAGDYESTLINVNGCDSIIHTTLKVLTKTSCFVTAPNAFTPNGDGLHDTWKIFDGACVKKCAVKVYNRYGSPVYESGDYQNDWRGTYKSKNCPDGTYYYLIEVIYLNGRRQTLRGDVTIIR
ncbi:MAG: gliding motility-associated C-terminal domain-containing protein [Ferruginibacter sp.]